MRSSKGGEAGVLDGDDCGRGRVSEGDLKVGRFVA